MTFAFRGIKKPSLFRDFSKGWNLDSSNFLTFTNPKVGKNGAIAPTAVWHGTPVLYGACPAAGTCTSVCLHKAGNVQYLDSKIASRLRRSRALYYDKSTFMQFLVWQLLRHRAKHSHLAYVGARLNGTTDHRWEFEHVEFDEDVRNYIFRTTGFYPADGLLIEVLHTAGVVMYDYTKRIDRDFALCRKYGYKLTMSHGSVHGHRALQTAFQYGLNYAAPFNLSPHYKNRAELPRYLKINSGGVLDPDGEHVIPVIDGDVTDWRPGDPGGTNVVGLRIKHVRGRTVNLQQRAAAEAAFCVDPSLYVW